MTFIDFVLNVMDPFGVIRNRILKPFFEFSLSIYDHYRSRTKEGVLTIRDLIFRMAIVALAIAIIIWTAVFMYVAFYYTHMPAIAHTRPVNMQFETCSYDTSGLCSFPHAHVSLTKKQQLLMVGQSYRIFVYIDMPESPQNQKLGMFLVCADLRDASSKLRGHSCRSAMLRYKSPLLQQISTWLLSPLLILGLREEYQNIPVELFSNYNEEQLHPVTDVYIEVQSKAIQFYSVSLHIIADFTGLRYVMFHWPTVSAIIGISSNLFFILMIFLLSWYHWSDTKWIVDAREHYQKFRKTKSDLSTTTIDDSNNILDDDDLSILEEKSSNKSDDIEEVSGASGVEGGGEEEEVESAEIRQRKLTQTEYGF
ncbi:unnamed protein product [Hermetia illucens]|uniref:Seipin n=1 Tax=Hermetia illucens TaxID=343691 RepID=A0A7R8V1Q2_HERIL|nr:seipin [Hermetia illucens]CAD7090577.1 unnamed protein product [Hermetia illucens]